MANDTFELDPKQITIGMVVDLANDIPGVIKRGTYTVTAVQLPHVVLAWLDTSCAWVVDTREARLTEMGPGIVTALAEAAKKNPFAERK